MSKKDKTIDVTIDKLIQNLQTQSKDLANILKRNRTKIKEGVGKFFAPVECPYCGKSYDPTFVVCPFCNRDKRNELE